MGKIKEKVTYYEFLHFLGTDGVARNAYEGSNYVHKVTVVFDCGEERRVKYIFNTDEGFEPNQKDRRGTIEMLVE